MTNRLRNSLAVQLNVCVNFVTHHPFTFHALHENMQSRDVFFFFLLFVIVWDVVEFSSHETIIEDKRGGKKERKKFRWLCPRLCVDNAFNQPNWSRFCSFMVLAGVAFIEKALLGIKSISLVSFRRQQFEVTMAIAGGVKTRENSILIKCKNVQSEKKELRDRKATLN